MNGFLFALVALAFSVIFPVGTALAQCRSTVYLTLDTGNMRHARAITEILRKHEVKATFFLANEPVFPDRKGYALDESWAGFWQALAAEGHAFGTHTWRHGVIAQSGAQHIAYRPQFQEQAGQWLQLDSAQFCAELKRVDSRFQAMTGRSLDPIWRAPGGRISPSAVQSASRCGYAHVHWAAAGFLGDELSSEQFPNEVLLKKALASVRDGDILMGHLGIWSRNDPFAPMFDPLISGLKARGFCFATMKAHPMLRKS
jgi:peptidoglycan/xylan/chitin deacetylase (PgdA/CDA1 family)